MATQSHSTRHFVVFWILLVHEPVASTVGQSIVEGDRTPQNKLVCLLQRTLTSSSGSLLQRSQGVYDSDDEAGHTDGSVLPPMLHVTDILNQKLEPEAEPVAEAEGEPKGGAKTVQEGEPEPEPDEEKVVQASEPEPGPEPEGEPEVVRLELHLTHDVRNEGPQGTVQTFLQTLQAELADAVDLPRKRLVCLGIRSNSFTAHDESVALNDTSENKSKVALAPIVAPTAPKVPDMPIAAPIAPKVSAMQFRDHGAQTFSGPAESASGAMSTAEDPVENLKNADRASSPPQTNTTVNATEAAGVVPFPPGISIVDFEVLPGDDADAAAFSFVEQMQVQLTEDTSRLMTGELREMLVGAKLLAHGPGGEKAPSERGGSSHTTVNSTLICICWIVLVASAIVA